MLVGTTIIVSNSLRKRVLLIHSVHYLLIQFNDTIQLTQLITEHHAYKIKLLPCTILMRADELLSLFSACTTACALEPTIERTNKLTDYCLLTNYHIRPFFQHLSTYPPTHWDTKTVKMTNVCMTNVCMAK